MASLKIRIRPTTLEPTEMALRRRQRSLFARLTHPLYRARVSRLMLAKMGWHHEQRSPPERSLV